MVLPRLRNVRMTGAFAPSVSIGSLYPGLTRRRHAFARSVGVLIPGNGVLETTTVGGTVTFFAIYQNVLLARIILTWFPAAANSPIARPLITVCDPYLNLFRQVVPPLFGLDLSPVLALFLLQAFGSATQALGSEMPGKEGQVLKPLRKAPWDGLVRRIRNGRI